MVSCLLLEGNIHPRKAQSILPIGPCFLDSYARRLDVLIELHWIQDFSLVRVSQCAAGNVSRMSYLEPKYRKLTLRLPVVMSLRKREISVAVPGRDGRKSTKVLTTL